MPIEDFLFHLSAHLQLPHRLAADTTTLTERYGRFSAQPFERGFGTTVGNSLRRALLSSIEGAAITAVKIEGVEHEFSSINGTVEDATDVILNLKKVPFMLHGPAPRTLVIAKEGPGEVTSGDIQEDASVEILDPDVHIASLLTGGSLNIEMRLKWGRGYMSADQNFDEDLSLGYIPIDSVHTPVKKVNYAVDAARLGQNTEYDKLSIEVWTDGSIKPEDAIGLAAKVIKDHMAIFINFEEDREDYEEDPVLGSGTSEWEVDELPDAEDPSKRLRMVIEALELRSAQDPLRGVQEAIQEESTARQYISQRYRTLINRRYLEGLSTNENDELEDLKVTLDRMEEPYYQAIIGSLSKLVKQRQGRKRQLSRLTKQREA